MKNGMWVGEGFEGMTLGGVLLWLDFRRRIGPKLSQPRWLPGRQFSCVDTYYVVRYTLVPIHLLHTLD